MNRDEKLTRIAGRPPEKRVINQRTVLCPSEPSGGTWIALNDSGTTLALVNWYSIKARAMKNPISRGAVVNAVSSAGSVTEAAVALAKIELKRVNPFRLIGVFPKAQEVIEWRWNQRRLVRKDRPWKTQQWISSGFDEFRAQRERNTTFLRAGRKRSAKSLDWLRRLHRSHSPERGPFSTCMHRSDAATVSYTEIIVSPNTAVMRYHGQSPCQATAPSAHRVEPHQ